MPPLHLLPLLLLAASASPLTEELIQEVEAREAVLEEQLLETLVEEERLLDVEGLGEGKFITAGENGDFQLLSVPWSRGASLTFNDTTASTLSTVGNAALFLGGLYLLSGFPAAAALADPFGFSRRLGVAAPGRPGPPPPKFQHRSSGAGGEQRKEKPKSKRPLQQKRTERPASKAVTSGFMPPQLKSLSAANEHMHQKNSGFMKAAHGLKPQQKQQKSEDWRKPQQKSGRPQERQQRPRFRLTLPTLRMPQLPRLRRPTFPRLNNPFTRRPRPAPQQARPAPQRPAPQQAAAPRPVPQTITQAAPVFRPSTASSRPLAPASQRAPAPQARPAPPQQAQQNFSPPQQSAPLRLPAPDLGASTFGGFDSDPFSEFQSNNFGPGQDAFQDLINNQFGADFDSQRLPGGR